VTSGSRFVDDTSDSKTVQFFLIRGLTLPVIFLLSIVVSFFSVGVAISSWVLLMAVDAMILRQRRSH
jgi:hypothetical protein